MFFFGNAWREAVYVIFYTELVAIYINISRTDRPSVLKSEVFRLEWEPENTPPELNRRTAPATYQLRQGVAHALNDWNL